MRIAFYAPLKPPTHNVPSGDRLMARQLLRALEIAGHKPFLASEFRSYEGKGDRGRQRALRGAAEKEVDRLLLGYRGDAPKAWLTYHLYYKAPDWLGPPICEALDIPYLVAEPSFAPKRANGVWHFGHSATADALARADIALCFTRFDMEFVAPQLRAPEQRLMYLPPFVDSEPTTGPSRTEARASLAARHGLEETAIWLTVVAMMRPGDKLASYRQLGEALHLLKDRNMRLLIAGDGPERPQVESALAPLGDRVCYVGELGIESRAELLAAADLYIWPAVGEAYGMALLEAQAAGVPVVAGRVRGVVDVVEDQHTGLLADADDPAALAARVIELIDDPVRRQRMSETARAFVNRQRNIASAATTLRNAIDRAFALRSQ